MLASSYKIKGNFHKNEVDFQEGGRKYCLTKKKVLRLVTSCLLKVDVCIVLPFACPVLRCVVSCLALSDGSCLVRCMFCPVYVLSGVCFVRCMFYRMDHVLLRCLALSGVCFVRCILWGLSCLLSLILFLVALSLSLSLSLSPLVSCRSLSLSLKEPTNPFDSFCKSWLHFKV